jgi:hypothetical protein
MAKMKKYMVVHNDPFIYWQEVEESWAKLASVEKCTWVRALFNKGKGLNYCEWLAPDEDTLRSIFRELFISYESIVEVKEAIPNQWDKNHLAAKQAASSRGF